MKKSEVRFFYQFLCVFLLYPLVALLLTSRSNSRCGAGGVYFDAAGSDNVFTVVVPEPCTLLLLGIGCVALRRRS